MSLSPHWPVTMPDGQSLDVRLVDGAIVTDIDLVAEDTAAGLAGEPRPQACGLIDGLRFAAGLGTIPSRADLEEAVRSLAVLPGGRLARARLWAHPAVPLALAFDVDPAVRCALAMTPETPPEALGVLSRDPLAVVRTVVAGALSAPAEAFARLGIDPDAAVRKATRTRLQNWAMSGSPANRAPAAFDAWLVATANDATARGELITEFVSDLGRQAAIRPLVEALAKAPGSDQRVRVYAAELVAEATLRQEERAEMRRRWARTS